MGLRALDRARLLHGGLGAVPFVLLLKVEHGRLLNLLWAALRARVLQGARDAGAVGLHGIVHGVEDQLHLVRVALETVIKAGGRHIGLQNVVDRGVRRANPGSFHVAGEPALQHAVSGQFAQIRGRKTEELLRQGVLLHEGLLGLVEHQRVVRAQAHVQTADEEIVERRLLVGQEEVVVRAGRHCNADPAEVVQVLERRRLAQVEAVRDAISEQESCVEVVKLTSLACVRPVVELVEAHGSAQFVQHSQVALQVEVVVLVGGVCLDVPLLRRALNGGKCAVAGLVAL
mmetsp:Transcript_409/g.993  ORF Transcript_409/g.993 Transcript_409/m.993 type:complete len:287 (+) Transcript_409:288-1148(+)